MNEQASFAHTFTLCHLSIIFHRFVSLIMDVWVVLLSVASIMCETNDAYSVKST